MMRCAAWPPDVRKRYALPLVLALEFRGFAPKMGAAPTLSLDCRKAKGLPHISQTAEPNILMGNAAYFVMMLPSAS